MSALLPLLDLTWSTPALPDPVTVLLEAQATAAAELPLLQQAMQDLGMSGKVPACVLADDRLCRRFWPEPPSKIAQRLHPSTAPVPAMSGSSTLPGQRVLAEWLACAQVVTVDQRLRDRLRRHLPQPLPVVGSVLAVVNLEAVQRLLRLLDQHTRRHARRGEYLLRLSLQRAVLQHRLQTAGAQTAATQQLLAIAHDQLLRSHVDKTKLRRLQTWLDDLVTPPSAGSQPPRNHMPQALTAATGLSATWMDCTAQLHGAGVRVFRRTDEPPEPPRERHDIHPRVWRNEDEPARERAWVKRDRLGCYVSPKGTPTTLPPGVHLFCDRIEAAIKRKPLVPGLTLETLAWQVLWHELCHWQLDQEGPHRSPLQAWAPFNLAELVCETVGYRALELGHSEWLTLPLRGPKRNPLPIRHWRQLRPLLPYSAFPALLLTTKLVSPATWYRAMVAGIDAQHRCEASWAQLIPTDPAAEALAHTVHELAQARLPLNTTRSVLRDLAGTSNLQELAGYSPAGPTPGFYPHVYLWSTHDQ